MSINKDNLNKQIKIISPHRFSHKGDNGKVLIIGGSDLFQAASQWSFQVVSRLVDMTFYSSTSENNDLLFEHKFFLQDGVVVKRSQLPDYLTEVDSVLIGPGMRRDFHTRFSKAQLNSIKPSDLNDLDWEFDTQAVTSVLLRNWPNKQWVIDAGSLQLLDVSWLPKNSIITPHRQELVDLLSRNQIFEASDSAGIIKNLVDFLDWLRNKIFDHYRLNYDSISPFILSESEILALDSSQKITAQLKLLKQISSSLNDAMVIYKGAADFIWNASELVVVVGGNAGLTKGGTGDVLAGLITGLAARQSAPEAARSGALITKLAAHQLYQQHGLVYNTSDLVKQIPLTIKSLSDS